MRILFDQGTPRPLRKYLIGHEVRTAYDQGWSDLNNGVLIEAAEAAGFVALITTDKNLRYQQNLASRLISILVLPTTKWLEIERYAEQIAAAVDLLKPGDYRELYW